MFCFLFSWLIAHLPPVMQTHGKPVRSMCAANAVLMRSDRHEAKKASARKAGWNVVLCRDSHHHGRVPEP